MQSRVRQAFVGKAFVVYGVLLYAAVCLVMWSEQRYIIYHPPHDTAKPPEVYGLKGFTGLTLLTSDGVRIAAWTHKASSGYPTVLFFHGTGGNMMGSVSYFRALTEAGFGLVAIDYRGYGASEGSPSEQGIYQDARAAIEFAGHTLGLKFDQMLLYGESLGTGVAVQMAMEFPVSAVILQSPYTSIENMAEQKYPWLPVSLLLEDKFDSVSKIKYVQARLLVLHGERDTVVPVGEGRKIFDSANEPKEAIYFPAHGHADLGVKDRVDALLWFARKYGLIYN